MSRILRHLGLMRFPVGVNQAVNLERGLIYIAIPKTGSSAIRQQVKPQGQQMFPVAHLDIRQVRDLIYPWLLSQNIGSFNRFPSHDIPTDDALRREAADTFRQLFKFSQVRNPWARTVSLYFRREGVQVSGRMSFAEFCDKHEFASDTSRFPTRHRNQIDWLTDENGALLVDFVGKLETLSDDIHAISDMTGGRVQLQNLVSNANERSKAGSYRDMYDDHTRALVAKRFEKDIDTFKYVF